MEIGEICTREAHEEGAELNITHPATGEVTDFYINVLGPDSRAWRKAIKTDFTRLLSNKGAGISEDDLLDSDINKLAAITSGWRGLQRDGKDVEFSLAECKKLYNDSPQVMTQVDVFVGNSRNFTKG
jgi:hypothetical protein